MGARAKSSRSWLVIDTLAILGIVFFTIYYLTSLRFDNLFTAIGRQVDFRQWYFFPPVIAQHLQYPTVVWNDWTFPFPYLPSAVAMFMPLSALPNMAAFALWIGLQAVAFAVVLWTGLQITGADRLPGRFLIALGAVLLTDNQIGWDFRTHNNNMIYLALVMVALWTQMTWLSALLLGISSNLKVYSGVLFFVFLWRREYRLALSMIAAAVLIATILPIAVFGFSGYVQLLHGWAGQALFYAPPAGKEAVLPANLWRAASALIVGDDPGSTGASILLRSGQAVWIAIVAGYFFLAARQNASAQEPQARLADVCVGLLAPLPFSIWFTPYHAIVLLPINMLLLTVAANETRNIRTRCVALATLVACQILQYAFPSEFRGATYFVIFTLVVVALGVVRSRPGAAGAACHPTRREGIQAS
jgi:hypothetical protein